MADVSLTTPVGVANPLPETLFLFDEVVSRLATAVALTEAIQHALLDGDLLDVDSTVADAATADALAALGYAVSCPWEGQPAASRILASALHTLHLALLGQDAGERTAALAAACRHPSLQPLGFNQPQSELLDHRLEGLCGLVERLRALTAVEPHEPRTAPGLEP